MSARAAFYSTYYTHEAGAGTASARPSVIAEMEKLRLAMLGYATQSPADRGWLRALSAIHPGGAAELGASILYLKAPVGGNRVLDVGCGNGDLMERLRRLGWDPVGVDPDPEGVAQAKRRNLDARVGTLPDQRFPSDYFDAIVSSHVIEHTDQPVELLRECQRVLKSGGLLIFVTPNLNALCRRLFGSDWSSLDPPRHLMLHTGDSLSSAATHANLEVISCGSTVRYARSVLNLSGRLLLRGRLRGDEAVGWLSQLMAVPVQLLERVLVAVGIDYGEELRLIATKREPRTDAPLDDPVIAGANV
jgi:2-polyprenyl-3-methyl-5-hydroxy-6-metoxy-1,4-benzoquinol methylase